VEPSARENEAVQAAIDAALEGARDAESKDAMQASEGAGGESPAPPAGSATPAEWEALRKRAAERDELLGLLQHVRADYANYQKRVQKEIDGTRRFAAQPLILDLLPVIDNLERALQSADAGSSANGLVDGVRLVHQQLVASLARHGVEPVAAAGLPFNPACHEALTEQPAPDKPARTVLQELQKGYTLHGRVIRPARVIVSAAGAGAGEPPDATESEDNTSK
jgi:molecular chaperone GrpE